MTSRESSLAINIRKATNSDETAPKRKHVRSCIVYTWDHKSSEDFWVGMKVHPIADEVQTFKALITIHKVLQEGHPATIKDAIANRPYIDGLSRAIGDGVRGYAPLIREYVRFLLAKLAVHQHHEFNGVFEYDEYISLRATNDPNEGYETISDLMDLQDKIEQFQKLVFSHLGMGSNECRISALVPLVTESFGIYKFATSMLRAMHRTTPLNALAPLRDRYDAQHHRLVKFYLEAANLRYLTSLIQVPRLPHDPPSLLADDPLPEKLPEPEVDEPPSPPAVPAVPADPPDIADFWHTPDHDALIAQRALAQRDHDALAQRAFEERALAQRVFEDQQRALADQQRALALQQQRDHDALIAHQAQSHVHGRLADLERENLAARAQYDRDQLLLLQYDQRVKALDADLARIQTSNDAQIAALHDQLATWRAKYDALAKLYSQLRTEHLDLLTRFKAVQLKAASAQEAIDKRDALERDLKTKNLDLAGMIRERDALEGKLKTKNLELAEREREREDERERERLDLDTLKHDLLHLTRERHRLERDLHETREHETLLEREHERLKHDLDTLNHDLDLASTDRDVYKAAMDQALLAQNSLPDPEMTDAVDAVARLSSSSSSPLLAALHRLLAAAATAQRHIPSDPPLLSAAAAVAAAAASLLDPPTPLHLAAAASAVAAASARLLAATRVKARPDDVQHVEHASAAVAAACRDLVQPEDEDDDDDDDVDYSNLPDHDFKVTEIEQQVLVLRLENALAAARRRLARIRNTYQEE